MSDGPVTLRRLNENDLEPVHALLSEWSVVRYMLLPHCESREESRKYLDDLMNEDSSTAWRSHARAMILRSSEELIGLCGIVILHGSEQGEIWYLVRPDLWGRGIASEAVGELLALGFGQMELHRIYATCLPENPGSARVLEKAGMRKECTQLKALKIHGVWRDGFLYAILRDEWESARK